MAERYSIDGQILTDIGDAIRSKTKETKTEIVEAVYEKEFVGMYFTWVENIHIPGATRVIVKIHSITSDADIDNPIKFRVESGMFSNSETSYNTMTSTIYSTNEVEFPMELTIFTRQNNGDLGYLSIGLQDANGYGRAFNKTVVATFTGLDANDEVLVNKEIEVLNAFTPEQMANEISVLATIPDEAFDITGNCQYRFAYNSQGWLINSYGDRITCKDITNGSYMFTDSSVIENIPFELNFRKNNSTSISNMFKGCSKLKSILKINNCKPNDMNHMFNGCNNLRYLPEDMEDWFDWTLFDTSKSTYSEYRGTHCFNNCFSLRSIPMGFLNHENPYVSTYSHVYNHLFYGCYALDEIIGLPLPRANEMTWTSNYLGDMISSCFRLKNFTFATNEDGTPIQVKWKSQTIYLNGSTGHSGNSNYILNYNSGITADKEVKDDATYQALKNDPDWFTTKTAYSRYNHDSAVRTINSLPDTSAYLATAGGTNTIRFNSIAGSATDGGAINTLTEEEIAVAVAKGWTVTLV